MDVWNPWIAETHVRRARWWEIALLLIVGSGITMAAVWFTTVFLMQLDQLFPWLVR